MAQLDAPKARQDALGNKIPEPEEELALLEREIFDLRLVFEKYFAGVERAAPMRRKEQVTERIRRLKSAGVMRTTAQKFRLEQVTSKFSSYDRMWTRTVTEMENGTFRRDLFKLKLHQQERAEREAREKAKREAADTARTPPASGAAAPAPARPAAPAQPLSDGQVRALFDTLVAARQRTGEPMDGLSFESLASRLRNQVPELMKRYDCKAVEFKVVIRDGRALLKAVPRK